ncbi:MAG: ADP-glyceromanno-heptose 6-epimerase [Deltaproteobacteria bacterium]
MDIQRTYWVTGAAGFIGSRFVESCQRRGIDVVSIDAGDHFKERTEHSHIHFGEVIDRDLFYQKLHAWRSAGNLPRRADAIIHLGACTDTVEFRREYLNQMNFECSKNLWRYAVTHGIPFVYSSSAATYGAGELGYNDDENLLPHLKPLNPYGQSKHDFDLWLLEEEREGRCPPLWAGFKFFNVYGYGERHKGKMSSVVLQAFDQVYKNGFVRLFKSHLPDISHGFQKRDFIFVQDVIDVLHFAIEKPIHRGIFNLGAGKARTFLDLVHAVFSATGKAESVQFIDTPIEIRDKYQYFTEAKMEKLRDSGYQNEFTPLERGVLEYFHDLSRSSNS